jgi:hypothetical protein
VAEAVMRSARSTLVLLAVLAGLGAYIYFVEWGRTPSSATIETKPKIFENLDPENFEEIQVRAASGEVTGLRKGDGVWQITTPVTAQADETEISGLASSLTSLEAQRVVEEQPKDLTLYGLAEPRIDVGFRATGDTALRHLLIGDKTATGGDLYAKLADAPRVFLISGFLESTFNRTPFEFRQKTILAFDRDKADVLEVTAGPTTLLAAKAGTDWRLQKPWEAVAEYSGVESILTRLSTAQMKSIAAETGGDVTKYGLDKPAVVAIVGTGSARARLEIGGPAKEGELYARDASRPMIFTVETTLADDLKKPPADLRRKDLFEFRPFNATRIEIARGGQTVAFEKTKGTGEKAEEKWRQILPAAKDVDTAKVDTLLSRLSGLRAESFAAPNAPTGLASPDATVSASFDEGKKQERVLFGRAEGNVYGTAGEKAPAAKLDTKAYEDAIKAVDEAVVK